MIWVEVIGYVAAALMVASLAMTSKVKLRSIALAGSLLFIAYGVMIGSWPVVVAHALIAAFSLDRLRRELSGSSSVTAIPIDTQAPFLVDFLAAHAVDITHSQPDYHPSPTDTFARLVNRDGLPAGVLIGEPAGNELLVKLDYVTPAFRDSMGARWLFGPGRTTFTDAGFTRLVTQAHTSVHRNYLEMMGFQHEGSAYVLDLH